MKTKHTPGEWEICAKTETQIFIASAKSGARTEQGKGSYICQIKQEREHHGLNEQDEANAKIILAAPDLLEVCNTFPGFNYSDPNKMAAWAVKLTNAINKATA